MSQADVPHFKFPFGRGQVVEQHTEEHMVSCAMVLLHCPLGFRLDRPEYGWPFPTFATWPIETTEMEAALERWAHPNATYRAEDWTDVAESAARQVTAMIQFSEES